MHKLRLEYLVFLENSVLRTTGGSAKKVGVDLKELLLAKEGIIQASK